LKVYKYKIEVVKYINGISIFLVVLFILTIILIDIDKFFKVFSFFWEKNRSLRRSNLTEVKINKSDKQYNHRTMYSCSTQTDVQIILVKSCLDKKLVFHKRIRKPLKSEN
jgi:hypothetical protein